MQITWLGAAGFRVRSGDTVFLIDPYLSRNPRARPAQALRSSQLDGADAIFLSHGHFDHARDLPRITAPTGARVYCGAGVDKDLAGKGLDPALIIPINEDGQVFELPGVEARAFFSRHVRFDLPLVLRTLARCGLGIIPLIRLNRAHPPGQVLAWRFDLEGRVLLHFGSAGADEAELSRLAALGVDLLLVPLQGHTRICDIAYEQVRRLRPETVIVQHHDDFYPPLSAWVDPAPLLERVATDFPGIRVIVPELNQPMDL